MSIQCVHHSIPQRVAATIAEGRWNFKSVEHHYMIAYLPFIEERIECLFANALKAINIQMRVTPVCLLVSYSNGT